MKLFNRFSGQHEDFVHDVAYDYYGKRLATCSSDHKIKVRWNAVLCARCPLPKSAEKLIKTNLNVWLNEQVWSISPTSEWTCEAELEGHKGAVWKLAWAHPEFGQILASCSFDQQVLIWEEQDAPLSANNNGASGGISVSGVGASGGEEKSRQGKWHQAAQLKDGRESVTDLKFAPRHLGLQVATCSSDGFVRIFSAEDVMNFEHWACEKFQAGSNKEEVTCLSWNPSRFDPAMLVVGES